MERYICIHGHFYQPPRENPWLEAVEMEDSAYPYHDWNERVTAECYAPNSASRILDGQGRIQSIVNNYSRISFNFGPTLISWLQQQSPNVYAAILEADRQSKEHYSGHGSAMAQAFNHMILPLANRRDKYTQVLWGIRDFELRFGRRPEGMWLPETAVDMETLGILAELGIKFTVLSPYQAARMRAPGGGDWVDVTGGRIDPSMAYRMKLRARREINVFFYDGPISRAAAFEDLLVRGENLAHRLASGFDGARARPQLVHMATDGETYGHHRRYADMALAFALDYIEQHGLAKLTNYGEYLARHPATHEVEILENTSWSCAHGIERWRSDCGCNSGGHAGWNQRWRAPLREALDWLRDKMAAKFTQEGRKYFQDPWKARNDYIEVIADRSKENVSRFLRRHCGRILKGAERVTAIKLLEQQRQAMLMYTSCGWFFDEISGIETVQVIKYAGRALQLGKELFNDGFEREFLDRLERAKSNIPEHKNGKHIYERWVVPAMVNLEKVGAHYAVSSLFEDYEETTHIYGNTVERGDYRMLQQGKARLAVGRAKVTSDITGEGENISFGVLHLGDHNVSGGVREYQSESAYRDLVSEVTEFFNRGDIPELIRAVDKHFGSGTYSLRLLFRDEQRRIVGRILDGAMEEADALYHNFHAHYATLARFVKDLGVPLPKRFQIAAEWTLNEDLRAELSNVSPKPERVARLLDQAEKTGAGLDQVTLEFTARRAAERAAEYFRADEDSLERLKRLSQAVTACRSLPFPVHLWTSQNVFYEVMQRRYLEFEMRAKTGDGDAKAWVAQARALGTTLDFCPFWDGG